MSKLELFGRRGPLAPLAIAKLRVAPAVARILTVALLLIFCTRASALDPSFDASQYGYKSWKVRDGFIPGRVAAITQTRDGYLWLGTVTGLFRFDGVRTVPFKAASNQQLPNEDIRALLGARDGSLWIGAYSGLVSWKDGRLTRHPELGSSGVLALAEERDGTIWAAGFQTAASAPPGKLCSFAPNSRRGRCVDGVTFKVSDGLQLQLLVDSRGTVWAAGGNRVWRVRPGPPRAYALPGNSVWGLAEDPARAGAILVSGPSGISRLSDDKVEPYQSPGRIGGDTSRLLRDRGGSLWIGTTYRGLLHQHGRRLDAFDRSDGLSGNQIRALYEDREGSIWVGSGDGLDRFHDISVANIAERQGVSSAGVFSVLAARDGSVWFGQIDGLGHLRGGDLTIFRADDGTASGPGRQGALATNSQPPRFVIDRGLPSSTIRSLLEDSRGRVWVSTDVGLAYFESGHFNRVPAPHFFVSAMAEDRWGIWLAQLPGLVRVTQAGSQSIPWTQLGHRDPASSMTADPGREGVWIGFDEGGIAYVVNGRVRKAFTTSDGLAPGTVVSMRFDGRGALWIATDGGLSRLSDGRITTLTSKNGLTCDTVHWSIEDNAGAAWLYTPCAMVRITRAEMDAWVADPGRRVATKQFDQSDGVRTQPFGTQMAPLVAKSADGRIWFLPFDGLSVFDPSRLKSNRVPPPVHVEQVIADHKPYDASAPIRLPPRVRDITIDYTALSFVAPEKVRFRYRLDGRDKEWVEAGNRRQAFYTDLPPGTYRFQVIAANNSGVWNNTGASLQLSIAPAWWQTKWFSALAVIAVALLLWGAHKHRIRKLEREGAREKEVQERQRELQKELAHATRLSTMGQLTASISHEIRQPLAAVISHGGAAKRWLEQSNLAKVRYSLDAIIQTTERAGDIITGLRALAKKEEPRFELFNLKEAVREVILLTAGEAKANNVAVRTEFAAKLPKVRGDRIQLQQVILNLVVNAIEAMTSSTQRQLFVTTGQDSSDVFVEVRDTGPGLEPEAGERLFQSFYTTKEGGMGMGLSLSRSIVEAHGGHLSAVANEPHGAVFRFTLPIEPLTTDQRS